MTANKMNLLIIYEISFSWKLFSTHKYHTKLMFILFFVSLKGASSQCSIKKTAIQTKKF